MSKAGANRKRAFMWEKNMLQLYLALIDEEWDLIRFEEAYYEYKGLLHYIAKKFCRTNIAPKTRCRKRFCGSQKTSIKLET